MQASSRPFYVVSLQVHRRSQNPVLQRCHCHDLDVARIHHELQRHLLPFLVSAEGRNGLTAHFEPRHGAGWESNQRNLTLPGLSTQPSQGRPHAPRLPEDTVAPTTGLIDTSYHTAPTAHPMVIRPQERADRRDRQPGTSSGHHRRGRPKHHSQREPVSTRSKPSESLLEKEVLDTTTVKRCPKCRPRPSVQQRQPLPVSVCPQDPEISACRFESLTSFQRSRHLTTLSSNPRPVGAGLGRGGKGPGRVFLFFLCCFGHSRC